MASESFSCSLGIVQVPARVLSKILWIENYYGPIGIDSTQDLIIDRSSALATSEQLVLSLNCRSITKATILGPGIGTIMPKPAFAIAFLS